MCQYRLPHSPHVLATQDLQLLQKYNPWGKPAPGAPRVSTHIHTPHTSHLTPPSFPPSSGLPVVRYWPEGMPPSPDRRRRLVPAGRRGPANTPHLVGLGVEPRSCHMTVRWTPLSESTRRQDSRNTFAKKLTTHWYIPHTSCLSHMWCLYLCVCSGTRKQWRGRQCSLLSPEASLKKRELARGSASRLDMPRGWVRCH